MPPRDPTDYDPERTLVDVVAIDGEVLLALQAEWLDEDEETT